MRMCSRDLVLALALLVAVPAAAQQLQYPPAPKGDVADDYFGHHVADPYRWLEDLDASATKSWVDAENALTFGYLSRLPQRDSIRARLTALWNYPKVSVPVREAGQLWFRKNSGLQRQSVLFRASAAGAAAGRGARSQRAVPRRLDRRGAVVGVARWADPGLHDGGGRLGPAGHPLARPGQRAGPARRRGAREVHGHVMDAGQQGVLLLALPQLGRTRQPARCQHPPPVVVPHRRRGRRPHGVRARRRFHRLRGRRDLRRRPLAVRDLGERHLEQPGLAGRPEGPAPPRPRGAAASGHARRGRGLQPARRGARHAVPVHELDGAARPHRRGGRGRQ